MTDKIVDEVNALPGWVKEMGIVILTASADEVTCEWEVTEKHHQGYGIVHGGVHSGVIETLASVGAAMVAVPLYAGWGRYRRLLEMPVRRKRPPPPPDSRQPRIDLSPESLPNPPA